MWDVFGSFANVAYPLNAMCIGLRHVYLKGQGRFDPEGHPNHSLSQKVLKFWEILGRLRKFGSTRLLSVYVKLAPQANLT